MTPGESDSFRRPRAIFALALPIIAGIGSQNLMNLVDTAMLGRLGATAQGAVGLSSMLIWVMSGLVQGMGSAVQAKTARRLGEGAVARTHEALSNGLSLTLWLGLPLTALLWWGCEPIFGLLSHETSVREAGTEYTEIRLLALVPMGWTYCFRGFYNGCKRAHTYMLVLFLVHPLNMLLNYLLIFGFGTLPALGVRGAALGTLIANMVGAFLLFWIARPRRTDPLNSAPASSNPSTPLYAWVPSWPISRDLLRLSLPASGHALLLAGGFLLFFRIAAHVGTQTLAATTVLVNIALTCILISMGFGLASITLVGESLGRQLRDEAKEWVRSTLKLAWILVGGLGLLMAIFAHQVLSLFILDPQLREQAVIPLVLLGLSQGYNSAAIVFMHALQGGGAARSVMNITFVTQWLLFLPACWLWVDVGGGGLLALWICYVAYRFLLFLGLWREFRQDHWLNHLF